MHGNGKLHPNLWFCFMLPSLSRSPETFEILVRFEITDNTQLCCSKLLSGLPRLIVLARTDCCNQKRFRRCRHTNWRSSIAANFWVTRQFAVLLFGRAGILLPPSFFRAENLTGLPILAHSVKFSLTTSLYKLLGSMPSLPESGPCRPNNGTPTNNA